MYIFKLVIIVFSVFWVFRLEGIVCKVEGGVKYHFSSPWFPRCTEVCLNPIRAALTLIIDRPSLRGSWVSEQRFTGVTCGEWRAKPPVLLGLRAEVHRCDLRRVKGQAAGAPGSPSRGSQVWPEESEGPSRRCSWVSEQRFTGVTWGEWRAKPPALLGLRAEVHRCDLRRVKGQAAGAPGSPSWGSQGTCGEWRAKPPALLGLRAEGHWCDLRRVKGQASGAPGSPSRGSQVWPAESEGPSLRRSWVSEQRVTGVTCGEWRAKPPALLGLRAEGHRCDLRRVKGQASGAPGSPSRGSQVWPAESEGPSLRCSWVSEQDLRTVKGQASGAPGSPSRGSQVWPAESEGPSLRCSWVSEQRVTGVTCGEWRAKPPALLGLRAEGHRFDLRRVKGQASGAPGSPSRGSQVWPAESEGPSLRRSWVSEQRVTGVTCGEWRAKPPVLLGLRAGPADSEGPSLRRSWVSEQRVTGLTCGEWRAKPPALLGLRAEGHRGPAESEGPSLRRSWVSEQRVTGLTCGEWRAKPPVLLGLRAEGHRAPVESEGCPREDGWSSRSAKPSAVQLRPAEGIDLHLHLHLHLPLQVCASPQTSRTQDTGHPFSHAEQQYLMYSVGESYF